MSPSGPRGAALQTGALLAVTSLPTPGGPLVFVALVPLFRLLLRGVGARGALCSGALAGTLHSAAGFGWVLLADPAGGAPAWVAFLVALPLLAAELGGWALGVSLLARRSRRLALAAAPGSWVALEYARAQEWGLGVPWNHLGYALGDWPALVQAAGYTGVHGLSFWIVSVNALVAALPRLGPGWRALLASLLAVPLLPGAALLADAQPRDALRVVAVQPDLREDARRDAGRFAENVGLLHAASRRALAVPAQLVVWPESAYQRVLGARGDAFLAALAHDFGAPLVTGVWSAEGPGGARVRNAAVLALPDGRTPLVAEKQHPVPVYEREPGGPLARWLARRDLWPGRFAAGRARPPFLLPRAGAPAVSVGVLVCVDASYPEVARRLRGAGARLLLAISNEAGTGRWSADLHARVTRLRAVEARAPIVRVASRGPSLWIDERGRIVAALPAGRAGSAGHALALAGPPAPFVGVGDARVAAAAALSAAVAGGLAFTPGRACRAPAPGQPPGTRGTIP
jgi:apolipoprotein N-acyltransferase